MNFDDTDDICGALESGDVSIRDLYRLYERRQPVPESLKSGMPATDAKQIAWLQENVSNALLFTECALARQEFLLVCDVAREALRYWGVKNDHDVRTKLVRLRINYATAQARLGFPQEARRELEPCVDDNFQPRLGRGLKAEILRRLGNIHRDEAQQAASREVRLHMTRVALDFFKRSLLFEPDHFETQAVIAAASMVVGDLGPNPGPEAFEPARQILQTAERLRNSEGPRAKTTRWMAACHIILGEIDAAIRAYGELKDMDDATATDLADARYNARFLAEALGKPRDTFEKAFPPLQLVVFVGHLPDRLGRPPRFPHASVERVRQDIRAKVAEMDVRVGLVSAAAGADLLFIEALLERKGTVHLVLPWSIEEFRKTSVRPFEPPGAPPVWEPLFDRALKEAATIREIGEAYEGGSDVSRRYAMEVTAGLALQTARVSRLDVQPVALWDRLPDWGSGGTSSFVDFWRGELGLEAVIVDLPGTQQPDRHPTGARSGTIRSELSTTHHEVKSMLFADIAGYSRLPERVIPAFVETFMSRVSLLVAQSRHAPRSVNTWGDAIYAIFDFASDAGAFALELAQMVREGKEDWLKAGLYWEERSGEGAEPVKHPLNVRIGLHTGPVFRHYDPVVRQLGFTGAHVSRAARIEPVVKPGQVFASEQFAALAELDAEIKHRKQKIAESESEFVCQFAGTMQLAKGYPGRHRIYRVMPKRVLAAEDPA